jgi:hypothetical protein
LTSTMPDRLQDGSFAGRWTVSNLRQEQAHSLWEQGAHDIVENSEKACYSSCIKHL